MARTVRDLSLDSRTARLKLRARGKPYYRKLEDGLHLGYRKNKSGGGKWVMRRYVGGQDYIVETIGTADDVIDADGAAVLSFNQAQAKARDVYTATRREAVGLSARSGPYRVRDAVDDYLKGIEAGGRPINEARHRSDAFIIPEFGDVECARLSKDDLQTWLEKLAKSPARLRTKKGDAQQYRQFDDDPEALRRRRNSANRVWNLFRATLNSAWQAGKIANDSAWRRVKPLARADAARIRYLTLAECKRLINASPPEFRKLVQAALLTGCRYGELCELNAGDYNPDAGTLHIRMSKTGKGRHVVLTDEGKKFFSALAAGSASDAPMIAKSNGERWGTTHQSRPMSAACKQAKIAPAVSFHVLRHTWASLTIMDGAPLLVVAKNLGHTDTRMVERHYGHLSQSYVADQIRQSAPKFGIKVSNKVVELGATK